MPWEGMEYLPYRSKKYHRKSRCAAVSFTSASPAGCSRVLSIGHGLVHGRGQAHWHRGLPDSGLQSVARRRARCDSRADGAKTAQSTDAGTGSDLEEVTDERSGPTPHERSSPLAQIDSIQTPPHRS